jgi:hypothetical protein
MWRFRYYLSWWLHNIGMVYLAVSESVQGDGPGPWETADFDFRNQFTDASFRPD